MEGVSPQVAQAIKMAIELEKDGHAFFKDAAARTSNKLGKQMFEKLAKDEIEHLETFKNMFDSMSDIGEWRSILKELKSVPAIPAFADVKNKVKATREPDEVEAIREAMEVERKAIDFFNDAKSKTTDAIAQGIFDRIMQEEEFHHALLQAQYDSVTGAGFWLDTAELRMEALY